MRTLDASRIIPRFRAPTSFTVTRKSTGTYTKGRYTPNASSSTFAVTNASFQPLKGRELLLLPEGFRTKEVAKVYSPVELRAADATLGYEADRFDYLGKTWEVHASESWNDHGGFWKVTVVKVHG